MSLYHLLDEINAAKLCYIIPKRVLDSDLAVSIAFADQISQSPANLVLEYSDISEYAEATLKLNKNPLSNAYSCAGIEKRLDFTDLCLDIFLIRESSNAFSDAFRTSSKERIEVEARRLMEQLEIFPNPNYLNIKQERTKAYDSSKKLAKKVKSNLISRALYFYIKR